MEIKKRRDEIIIILSHKKLKPNQLYYLCKTDVTFECWYELIQTYVQSDYSDEQFSELLDEFLSSRFESMKNDLFLETQSLCTISDSKKLIFSSKISDCGCINH